MGISDREHKEQLDRIERALRQVRICLIIVIVLALPIMGPFALAIYAKFTEWISGFTTPAMLFPLALIVAFVLFLLLKLKPEP